MITRKRKSGFDFDVATYHPTSRRRRRRESSKDSLILHLLLLSFTVFAMNAGLDEARSRHRYPNELVWLITFIRIDLKGIFDDNLRL